ncbi:acetate--CoA ligase family protein [Amylibacter sp. IMCC11727]|uniref:acetate--CoA ligase family protein n=1 Tax=Amylibacter sp. IMCC11727 TaxID=3039851 RepID=UPI00244E0BDD|nr:acetate--CoA ligase family protein [Amylibacter sp. IMCC11727]WGI21788.1 acetate--CoA ligase family protein [Amylibacter sp. IMCC11727]
MTLNRLINPNSIAIIGGGAWCASVAQQAKKMGFSGEIYPVHPKQKPLAGIPSYATLADLPNPPDACFIGVNRHITLDVVRELSAMGAGGAICFASGFSEAEQEDDTGTDLQAQLVAAAGDMPILGPNCYGLINYLDRAILWPDQHGGMPVDSGVAIITQSSNMAINITMQARALPIAVIACAGNQAQTGMADIGFELLQDPRITALGLHIEGFNDLHSYETLAAEAHRLGKPIVALKVGKSEQAQAATISHTASVAGGDAGAAALLKRLNIARVTSLPTFMETLKLLHFTGPLPSANIASISCSGGEASLAADTAVGHAVNFPPLTQTQQINLRAALGPMVALANPLDYHTYIWRDADAMTAAWAAMMEPHLALTVLVVDFPRADRCSDTDWDCAIEAAGRAKAQTGANVAMVTTLPENLSETIAKRLVDVGVIPLLGLRESIEAVEAAASFTQPNSARVLLPTPASETAETLSEGAAKHALAAYGLRIPNAKRASSPTQAAEIANAIGFPVVVKGEGIAHKSEAGAVALNLQTPNDVSHAAKAMPTDGFLIEEMLVGGVAELLIGVVKDPAHGFVLTLGAGGTFTELLSDSASLLIPASRSDIETALSTLKSAKLLSGFRGATAAHMPSILDAVEAIQNYVLANAQGLEEVEVNPLICTPTDAIAADALIRRDP